MTRIAIIKTGALGDVLRTTSILPGLHARYPELEVDWITAPSAADLVRTHSRVARVLAVDPEDATACAALGEQLAGTRFDRVLSFDDEAPLCALASRLDGRVSGAYLDSEGARRYTPDVGPWFDMGLLSIFGKQEADRRKLENRRSHPEIFAAMLGIEMGEPELALPDESRAFARAFCARRAVEDDELLVGLNTGAGGRWESKKLPVERTIALARELSRARRGKVAFLVLGGAEETARNRAIIAGLDAFGARAIDAGTDNSLLDFAALIDRCDLLVASDSLALHVAVARRVRAVAFFAPTSAAEIELYGRGEKVASTAPDSCSYRPDADTSTLTVERLLAAVLRHLPGERS